MQSAVIQIKNAYELNSMSIEEICSDLSLESVVVKAALMQCSPKYRKDCGKEDEESDNLNFSDEQLSQVNSELYKLAMCSEDEHLRFKALTYIRDDKKGRKDVVKQIANQTFNVLQFNESVAAARQARARLMEV